MLHENSVKMNIFSKRTMFYVHKIKADSQVRFTAELYLETNVYTQNWNQTTNMSMNRKYEVEYQ